MQPYVKSCFTYLIVQKAFAITSSRRPNRESRSSIVRPGYPRWIRASYRRLDQHLDDAILIFIGQVRVHWQTEDSIGCLFRDGKVTLPMVQVRHRIEQVHRRFVIDHCGNAFAPEAGLELVAPLSGDSVLRPDR